MSANNLLFNAFVRHQVGVLRLGSGYAKSVLAVLKGLDRQLAEIAAQAVEGQVTEAFLAGLRAKIGALYAEAGRLIRQQLQEFGYYESEITLRIINSVFPQDIGFVFNRPSAAQIVAAFVQPIQGRTFEEWWTGLAASAFDAARKVVRMGAVEGKTVGQMTTDLRQRTQIDRRGAEAVVRTLVNGVATSARQAVLTENASIFDGVQWVSTLDARTTPICQERDGEIFPVDSGPRPPAHINCRSTIVPLLKNAAALGLPPGTRAAFDGPVSDDVTYAEWLRRQSVDVQEEVLGKKRAQLFRDGKLALDRFIDSDGQYYTLDQLRQREGKAWKRVFDE